MAVLLSRIHQHGQVELLVKLPRIKTTEMVSYLESIQQSAQLTQII